MEEPLKKAVLIFLKKLGFGSQRAGKNARKKGVGYSTLD